MTFKRRHQQRSHPLLILMIDASAAFEQSRDYASPGTPGRAQRRHTERRPTVGVGVIDIGAEFQKMFDDFRMAHVSRRYQRRTA